MREHCHRQSPFQVPTYQQSWQQTSYLCNSDGTTEDGYGVRTLCWEDSDKNWARVQDCSHRGFALDAGLLVHPISKGPWKGLTLTLGISWISRDYLDAEAGIAWRFF